MYRTTHIAGTLASLFLAGALTACAGQPEPATIAAAPTAADKCAALAQQAGAALGEPTARIVSAKLNGATAAQPPGASPFPMGALPEHCEVNGVMRERTGVDGQRYAVKFQLRLPTEWNGRFLFQGGGGTNGVLIPAVGMLGVGQPTGLAEGFAVVSTDTGHDNATNSNPARSGQVAFGHDYEARLELSEKSLDSVATAGKRLVAAYYGKPAAHNYFYGCSNGGREGMEFAQTFPDQFDGIVAVAPAFAVPKAAVAEVNDTQAFARIAVAEKLLLPNGLPDLGRTYSDGDLNIIADAINKACDADDGVADGMVQDFQKCTAARVRPALNARLCKGRKAEGCLSRVQVTAFVTSQAGPKNSKGEQLYAPYPYDPGIGNAGWRVWKIGAPGAQPGPISTSLGATALAGLFTTPPPVIPDTPADNLKFHLGFSMDRDAPKIFATTAEFPRSSWDLVGARSTDLSKFRARGGKMIVPHGAADPIFSLTDSVDWWNGVNTANGGEAASFARVFAIPGMTHCAGGPATDQYDAMTALVDWVEKGQAPDVIQAKAGPNTPWPGRSRPLCVYPAVARYKGGDVNKTESFACES